MHLFFLSIIIPESHNGFVFVDEKENNLNSGGPWWKPGVQVFSEISTWIFVPIILALIAGKALDKHYDTSPTMLLVSAGIGFLVTSFGIFRTVKNYMSRRPEGSESRPESVGKKNL